ncbi:MAG: 4Fe-4S binding protein [Thermoplasmatales archaeon]
MGSLLLALITIASMLAVIIISEYYLVPERASRKATYLIYFVLTMMSSMFIGLTYYLRTPKNFLDTVAAINIIMVPMISIIVILVYLYSMEFRNGQNLHKIAIPLLFVIDEFLMALFVLQLTGSGISPGLSAIPSVVNTTYFVVPMEVEMLFSIIFFGIKGAGRTLLIVLALMDLISPAIFPQLTEIFLFANALIMVLGMIVALEDVSKAKNGISMERERIINFSLLIYLLNSIGFFFYYYQGIRNEGDWLFYSLSVMAGMSIYFFLVLSGRSSRVTKGWSERKGWLFYILSISFLSELIMSVPLDIYTGIFSVSGSGIKAFFYLETNAVSSFMHASPILSLIPFIAAVANAPMFLILMGLEMGSLVVIRIKRIKWFEKRVNLSFALIAYATYTVLGPNYINGWDRLPLWANVGALGPVGGALIFPLIVSYLIYAVLAILFGRRSYCSTLCPSAVMYGGTLGQEMISMNYKSKLSKKNIGSRYSTLALEIASAAWIFMVISSVLSFAAYYGILKIKMDAAVLYSFLVWNFLWYIFFISIPFVGMSPCRRYGFCTTGTFVGFFSKIGFFKIKGIDPNVCFRCETKACVTACEVGLGDIPSQIMKKGYFKSEKCVGSGSCIMACPYKNIYFYDVRNAVKERLSAKKSSAQQKYV